MIPKQEQLTLRPHHIHFLSAYLIKRNNPRYIAYLTEVYGGANSDYFDNLDILVEKIKTNPNITVKIVNGIDDICRQCSFKEDCENDRSDKLRNATDKALVSFYGLATRGYLSLKETDAFYLKDFGIEIGKTYKFFDIIDGIL